MPSSKTGNKAARVAETKRLRNRSAKRGVKTQLVKAESSTKAREEGASAETTAAISTIDKAVNKGVMHRNRAARLKSRLTKKLNQALGQEAPE